MPRTNLLTDWVIPFLFMLTVALLYFLPYYQGYRFQASDQFQLEYTLYPLHQYSAKTGQTPLWHPTLFSGMPSHLMKFDLKNIFWKEPTYYISQLLKEYPPTILLVGLVGFFLFLWAEGLRGPVALAGAFAFVMMSYYTNMIVATHWGKSNVLFTAPYGLAGLSLLYQGRWALGMLLSLLGWAGMVGGHHPQMLYYVLFLWVAYGLYRLWQAWQNRAWKPFLIASALLLLSAGAGALSQSGNILIYYEYGAYSIRGKSELERDQARDPALKTGLDKTYAQNYSASRAELWSLIIPNFVGGTSQLEPILSLGPSSALYQALQRGLITDRNLLREIQPYWGGSPFSAGSFYAGIIPFFLIILGLLYKIDALDWILLYTGWIVLQLSLGAYGYSLWVTPLLFLLPWLSYALPRRLLKPVWHPWATAALFLIGWGLLSAIDSDPAGSYKLTDAALEYLPFYNKFRAPSTLLVLMGFLWGWMGMRGLTRFLEAPSLRQLGVALGLTAGILVGVGLGAEIWGFSLEGPGDKALLGYGDQGMQALEALKEDRLAIARRSTFLSLFWLILGGGILFLTARNLLKAIPTAFLLALFILADGWIVNSRYFPRSTTYVRKTSIPTPPPMLPYETYLKQNDTAFYRILPLHAAPFTDARPGVYLENAGGYHPAKLKRYQQLIEAHLEHLEPEVLRMLNIKYLTAPARTTLPPPFEKLQSFPDGVDLYRVPFSMRYAWLAESLAVYPRVDQTLDSLSRHDLGRVVLVAQRDLEGLPLQPRSGPLDSAEQVQVLQRNPTSEILLQVRTRLPRLLVLSEIHYPPGWQAFIDEVETPVIYANFVLRAVVVPAGEHRVRFYLRSRVHEQSARLSLAGSLLAWGLALLSGAAALWQWRRRQK